MLLEQINGDRTAIANPINMAILRKQLRFDHAIHVASFMG